MKKYDKQPIAMMCNREEFDAIKPKLESGGMVIDSVTSFSKCRFLVNNYNDEIGLVSNVSRSSSSDFSRSVFQEWNEEVFLRFCGIDTSSVDNTEQVDNVNKPAHYNQSGIECIAAIEASMSNEQFCGYLKGNIMKYMWRYEDKNKIEDLKKAQWYLNKLIEKYV